MNRQVSFKNIQLAILIMMAVHAFLYAQFTAAFWGDCRGEDVIAPSICKYIIDGREAGTIDASWQNGDVTDDGQSGEWNEFWGWDHTQDAFQKDFMYVSTSNHDEGDKGAYDDNLCPILPGACYFYHVEWDIPNSERKVHLFVTDKYFTDESDQLDVFEPILADIDPNDWIVQLNHAPTWGAMTYKDDEDNMIDTWMPTLVPKGLDFVLNGHAHVYRRTNVLAASGSVAEEAGDPGASHTSPDNSIGAVHIVNGRGGKFKDGSEGEEGSGWKGHAFAATDSDERGLVTLMTFDDNVAEIRTIYIDEDGTEGGELDSWTWTRGPASSGTKTAPQVSVQDEVFPVYSDGSGLYVDVPFDASHTVEITNLKGEVVKVFRGNANREYQWHGAKSDGVYFVRLSLPGKVLTQKIAMMN